MTSTLRCRWCGLSPWERLTTGTPIDPIHFSLFVFFLFQSSLKSIVDKIPFFARMQSLLLRIECLLSILGAVFHFESNLLRLSDRPGGSLFFGYCLLAGALSVRLWTKLFLVFLTCIRLCAIHLPIRFAKMRQ